MLSNSFKFEEDHYRNNIHYQYTYFISSTGIVPRSQRLPPSSRQMPWSFTHRDGSFLHKYIAAHGGMEKGLLLLQVVQIPNRCIEFHSKIPSHISRPNANFKIYYIINYLLAQVGCEYYIRHRKSYASAISFYNSRLDIHRYVLINYANWISLCVALKYTWSWHRILICTIFTPMKRISSQIFNTNVLPIRLIWIWSLSVRASLTVPLGWFQDKELTVKHDLSPNFIGPF